MRSRISLGTPFFCAGWDEGAGPPRETHGFVSSLVGAGSSPLHRCSLPDTEESEKPPVPHRRGLLFAYATSRIVIESSAAAVPTALPLDASSIVSPS
jgi:hypothetical protein